MVPRPILLIEEKRLAPVRLLDTWRCQGIDLRMYSVENGITGGLREVQQERAKAGPFGRSSMFPARGQLDLWTSTSEFARPSA